MQDKVNTEQKKKGFFKRHYVLRSLLRLMITVLVILACLKWVVRPYYLSGNNMYSAMRDGDLSILYLLEKDYYQKDIVAYEVNGKVKLGRVMARSGQEVDFPEIGGYTVDEYSPDEDISYETHLPEDTDVKFPLELKENQYFILNDYRLDTKDSRQYGVISKDAIIGKVIFLARRRGF